MTAMHVVESGHGAPTLVFVHGYTCDHTDWDAMVAELHGAHRCLAVDVPKKAASRYAKAYRRALKLQS